ncbi:Phosphatidylinositol (PI) 3-kinase [Marasmius crinis-equi]|uniref:Phosphatidylinositol 3-kinase VPS34 n=1 Tax=Marasmius crinis-equi TaxID=585013 RepID=A0ABR3FWS1_9AGAR
MGSASSKAARKLPKRTEVPTWNAARPAPPPQGRPNVEAKDGRPLASEMKDEAIAQDAQDPHFLANLSRLGPVNVNQPGQLARTPKVEKSRQLFESRIRADQEASSPIPTRNRVSASVLSTLLDQRKSARTQEEVDSLAKRYGIDPAKFGVVSKYVNSPSIQGGSALTSVGEDGEENVSVLLEGNRRPNSFTEILENPQLRFHGLQSPSLSDLYVTCQLVADNKPLTIPFRTSFKAFKNAYTWNEWITFPVRYCDLPLGAQVTFTVWDIAGPRAAAPVGGTTFRLFGKKGTLRRGKHRLLLWPGIEADGSVDSTTPSKLEVRDEMGRLEKLVKKYERGDLPKSDWLDKMTFRKMEEIHAMEAQKSENLFLYIDLPRFDFPVIFCEPEPPIPSSSSFAATDSPARAHPHPQTPTTVNATTSFSSLDTHLWTVIDPEIARENPVEDKHRRLVRSHRSGPYDRDLKPNAKDRDFITQILAYSPSHALTSEEKDLIWKFRFYLARERKGQSLTKFLKAVTWRDPSEVKQAVEELLPQWSEINVDDALELLGPGTVDSRVRAFAVRQLARADDDDLRLYLLQLVQALKFESAATVQKSSRAISYDDSGLADFLIERGVRNRILGNRLYWYLIVEVELEEDKVVSKMYGRVVFKFMQKILESENGSDRRELLRRQGQLVETLAKRARELRTSKDPRPKKIEKLRSVLSESKNGLSNISPPLPLPLDATIEITGIVPEKCTIFKSSLFPFLLYFHSSDGSEFPVMFKDGDDMRQDQLVVQLFTLMDRLLRKENLDLKIVTYDVLATGPSQGMVKFIASKSIAAIVSEYGGGSGGGIITYFRARYPDEGSVGTHGVEPGVVDTGILIHWAIAGYCVLTYILGVGDRHLDNLLVTQDVDFGYILGRDPKPFPPAVKVCKEMVDAMGGASSPHYARFKNFCFTAFTILRKSANLILNLVTLMVDANIPDIKHRDVHEQIREKFRLDLTEEEAIKHFETLLNETSYFTAVLDKIHDIAQYWRS